MGHRQPDRIKLVFSLRKLVQMESRLRLQIIGGKGALTSVWNRIATESREQNVRSAHYKFAGVTDPCKSEF